MSTPPRDDDWFPAPIRGLTALGRALAWLEGVGICTCLAAVILLAVWQFVERNLTTRHIPFVHVPLWVDGVIRHSVFMLGFLGAAYASHTGRHIRVDAVTRTLSPRKRLGMRIFTTLCALTILWFFISGSWGFYQVCIGENDEASQIGQLFTPARGALIMVIGYAVVAIHFFIQIVVDATWLFSGREPPHALVGEVHPELTAVAESTEPSAS